MKKQRAVYYARVSTEEEKQMNALDNQCRDLEDYIKSQDWKLVDKYIDEGKSGTTTKKRDEYNRLFNNMKSDKFDVIVIKSTDRLMRKTMDWYLFVNELVANNKKLFIYMENTYYRTDDSLISGIKAMLSEEYSRELSKKLNKAHARREREGSSIMTNGRLLGYDQVNGELIINEKEAKIVKDIYDMYINKAFGINRISLELKKKGIVNSKGNDYTSSTLTRLLQNEKYKGVLICNKLHKDFDTKTTIKNSESEWIIHKDRIPIIIEETIWDQAQKIRKSRTNIVRNGKRGKRVTQHPLANKLICGECGQVFWYNTINTRFNTIRYSWVCSKFSVHGRLNQGMRVDNGCNMPNVSTKKLNEHLMNVIKNFNVDKGEFIQEIIDELSEGFEGTADNELISLKSSIEIIGNKRELLLDKFLEGIIKEDIYKIKSSQLEDEYLEKKSRYDILVDIVEPSSFNELKEITNTLKEFYHKDMTYETFAAFIDKMIVYRDHVDIVILGATFPLGIDCSVNYK